MKQISVGVKQIPDGSDRNLLDGIVASVWGSEFNAGATSLLTGIDPVVLEAWNRRKLFTPSAQPSQGSGRRRMYTFGDLLALRAAALLRNSGVELQTVARCWQAIREAGDPKVISENTMLIMAFDGAISVQAGFDEAVLLAGGIVVPLGRILRDLFDRTCRLMLASNLSVECDSQGPLVVASRALPAMPEGLEGNDERDVDGGASGAAEAADAGGGRRLAVDPAGAPPAPAA